MNLLLGSARTPETLKTIVERLNFPNDPKLEFSDREHHAYLFDDYIEPQFSNIPIREMKVLMIEEWFAGLRLAKGRPLAGTTKSAIRTLLRKCFKLAAKHEFISAFEHNPMQLIVAASVSERQKELQQITVDQFKAIRAVLSEVLSGMVQVDAACGLRISELLALRWEDVDFAKKTVFIRCKFTQ